MSKARLKTGIVKVNTVIDSETGEVMEENTIKHKFLIKDKEQFYLLYTSILGVFQQLSNPAVKVYAYVLQYHNVGSPIGFGSPVINKIKDASELGCSTIRKALSELSEKCLLIKYENGRGYYEINPKYAWKGSKDDRDKRLKYLLELGFDLGE